MRWINRAAERTQNRRNVSDLGQAVSAAARAAGDAAVGVQFDVRRDVIGIVDYVPVVFTGFHGELLDGGINLPHVIDAGGGLRFGAAVDEVGDRYGRQQTNNGHHNHDLYQREAPFIRAFNGFHICSSCGVNCVAGGL